MDENDVIELDYVCDSDFTTGTLAGQISFSPVSFVDDCRNETKATEFNKNNLQCMYLVND